MAESKLEAVLWDLDGVIADTGSYHCQAWQYVFKKRGVNFTEDDFQHHFGQRNDTIIRSAMGEDMGLGELDVIAEEKEENYRQRVAQNITPLMGVRELMKLLRENEVKMAIASSAPMENIQLIIRGLGIDKCFQAIVYGREVTEGKPSPQVYLLAASKLGVKPQNCIVIEDAVAGVAGAKRAGMQCLAVTNSHPEVSLKEADLIVDSLAAVTVADLEKLFRQSDQD